MDVFDDLVAEQDRLEAVLGGLGEQDWEAPSSAVGWTVSDVVLHLAQTDEVVVYTAHGGSTDWRVGAGTLDDAMDQMVVAQRAAPAEIFERWRQARADAIVALREADPEVPLQWAATPLKPRTLATTRLAEHWAHALDITDPLAIPYPDTDRLRHIAWLGQRSLPYAFAFVGEEPREVFCELTAPDGSTWRFGPPDAESSVRGAAGEFCRVGARRLAPKDSGLEATGPYAEDALRVLRNYAG